MSSCRDYGFKDQIQRAAVSIMNNIAEGFESGSDAKFLNFLNISRGSCAEVRSMLYLCEDLGFCTKDEREQLQSQLRRITSGIVNLSDSISQKTFSLLVFKNKINMYKHFFKRVIDFTIALVALLVIWPILLIIYIWLTIANKGAGAIFYQERPGKGEKIFRVMKFKSMTDERDAEGNLLPNEKRITSVGRFIRKTSLDELPQLINVLKGDMALIGPRPLLPKYIPLYNEEQHRRHEVRPGITGWAQVNGRNNITWTEKFKLDVWYVDHCSLWLDIKIIFMTIKNVLSSKDIVLSTGPFNGNN